MGQRRLVPRSSGDTRLVDRCAALSATNRKWRHCFSLQVKRTVLGFNWYLYFKSSSSWKVPGSRNNIQTTHPRNIHTLIQSAFLSACLSVCLVCLSTCLSCLSVCLVCLSVLSTCLSACLSVLSVCLPVCLSTCLSICVLYVCLSVCLLSVCLSVCLSVSCLPACLSVCLYVCLSVCASGCMCLFSLVSVCLPDN